jgi:DNA processing protein
MKPHPSAEGLVACAGPGPPLAAIVRERDAAPRPAPAARAIPRSDPHYPSGLNDLSDAPATLHVRGAWPSETQAVGIVGSRAATAYGLSFAGRLAADLAALGVVVVSGLARGIDAAAHRGALDHGGTTVAVLPGGLDQVTPSYHRELAETIARRGAIVSEWPGDVPVRSGLFVRRNRLIAALSRATVVVEAAERCRSPHQPRLQRADSRRCRPVRERRGRDAGALGFREDWRGVEPRRAAAGGARDSPAIRRDAGA